jgi:putative tricarboxylic transport membrane protein
METRARRRFARTELAVGVSLLVLAGVLLFDAARLAPGSIYGVGPSAVPTLVAGGLILLGLATVLAAWREQAGEGESEAGEADRGGILIVLGGLAALIAAVALGGGFVIASAALFAATAWAFARRALAAAVMIGFALALVVYLGFTKLLALSLPQGPLERLVLGWLG